MRRRTHLRTRVLALTAVFACALVAIAFGLSWRAKVAHDRWSRIIAVEAEAIGVLEELIRAQNAFRTHYASSANAIARYRRVTQLLDSAALAGVDTRRLRGRVRAFEETLGEPSPRAVDLAATSDAIVTEASALAGQRKLAIRHQLPALRREAADIIPTGLAVAWIVILLSFAAAQMSLRKVVQPLEDLTDAADRIASGDLEARAPVAGDHEIAKLGVSFNRMADELRSRARVDELTSLPNFRAFRERLDAEIERAARYPCSFGVLVMDLDRFKKYNDDFGHLAGNSALQRVAAAMRRALRSVDFAARYGGEEFAVIAPEMDAQSLAAIAERVRASVAALPAPPDGAAVTVSIGGAVFPADGRSAETLFEVADQRLYDAKRRGRNCVVIGPTLPLSAEAAR
ncbi:MAG TPA: diguanylate cyclase [Thermoanaerobaculia bacterium]|nr:diguanylate cyclase [Thermoanaerobaculia bacterium]